MSQALRDARRYEEEKEAFIRPEDRPAFHLSTRVGWMNDPNGFSIYNGQYHLFYQYYPYDSHWGPMHWGHAVSEDLLHWRYLPAAMAPDRPYDRDGCFSGSALTLPDGRHLLMYTGVKKQPQPDGALREVQTQNLAFGDGVDYRKYEGNPILAEQDLPEGGSRFDFRDPKLWQEPDGSYRALIANDSGASGGQLLLYRSRDALHWELEGRLAQNRGRIGRMWECPDFFELDGYHVILGSAQDMLPKGFEYHNGNGTFCLMGHYSQENGFVEESDHAIDYGIDFYAPQTILTPDGRRVMIGWMQNWDTCNLHTNSKPWFGQMSLPRELFVKDGRLYQRPLRELERLRRDGTVHEGVALRDGELRLPGVSGRCVDLELELAPGEGDYDKFTVLFAKNDEYHTGVSFRPRESVLKIDRKFSGSRRAIIHQRRALVRHSSGALKLRLILDRFSVEVFVNDGEQVLSAVLYTQLDAEDIVFSAKGSVIFQLKSYRLEG